MRGTTSRKGMDDVRWNGRRNERGNERADGRGNLRVIEGQLNE